MKISIIDILRQEDIDYIDHLELENKKLKIGKRVRACT